MLGWRTGYSEFTVLLAAAATAGDTYVDAADATKTYVILTTKVGGVGTTLAAQQLTGTACAATGTLNKTSGSGDASIAWSARRANPPTSSIPEFFAAGAAAGFYNRDNGIDVYLRGQSAYAGGGNGRTVAVVLRQQADLHQGGCYNGDHYRH